VRRAALVLCVAWVAAFLALTLFPLRIVNVFAASRIEGLPGGGVEFLDSSLLASPYGVPELQTEPFVNAAFGVEFVAAVPHLTLEGPARIFGHTLDPRHQNWFVGQLGRSLVFRHRRQEVEFPGVFGSFVREHYVVTCTNDVVTLYRDGQRVATRNFERELMPWRDDCRFVIGNEGTGNRPWIGELHLLRIYDHPLDPVTAATLHAAHIGQAKAPLRPYLELRKDGEAWTLSGKVPLQLYRWPWSGQLEQLFRRSYFDRGGTFRDMAANLLGTLPFGVLLALALHRRTLYAILLRAALLQAALSVLVETVQFFNVFREADPMDCLLNVAGALLGVLLGRLIGPRVAR